MGTGIHFPIVFAHIHANDCFIQKGIEVTEATSGQLLCFIALCRIYHLSSGLSGSAIN